MYNDIKIKEPFFEIGPKAYCYGDEMLKLAKAADEASAKYDVQIILTPQYTDIPFIAGETKHLLVFAQHMDSLSIGRGQGSVLPEAIKYAGADGIMLNHAEKRVSLAELNAAIKRADEVGLATMVCADTIEEAVAIANLNPNIIAAEQPELIGTGQTSDTDYFKRAIEAVHSVNPEIKVLTAAGISNGDDVYNVIKKGASATGSSSAIFKAEDPAQMIEDMISAVRRAWDERHK